MRTFTFSARISSVVAAVLMFLLLQRHSEAGTITATNVDSGGLTSSTPVLDADGTPVPVGAGFVRVGTFETLTDDDLRRLSISQLSAASGDFFRYGSTIDFGHFGFPGLYSDTATRTTALPAEALGKPLYTVAGNGNSIRSSTELLIYKHIDQPNLADDPFSADADLSDEAGEIILGSFGRMTNISDGVVTLTDLASYQMARLVNDLVPTVAACSLSTVGEPMEITTASGDARLPGLAGNEAGASVLTWTSSGILGFRCLYSTFDASGALVVDAGTVDTSTVGQFGSVAAMRADGSFVIAWLALDGAGPDFHAHARRFTPGGTPEGDAIQVSTNAFAEFVAYKDEEDDERSRLSVAVHDATGDFAVGWGGPRDVNVRLFTSAGVAKGPPIVLDDSASGNLGSNRFGMSQVGFDESGNLFVAHRRFDEVTISKFDNSGTPADDRLVTEDSLSNRDPQLSVEVDGTVLLGWYGENAVPGADSFIRQWFDSDLHPLTSKLDTSVDSSEIGVARMTTGGPTRPHVTGFIESSTAEDWRLDVLATKGRQTLLPDSQLLERDFDFNQSTWRIAAAGNGILMAHEEDLDPSIQIVLRRYRLANPAGFAIPVNQTTLEDQNDADVATDGAGKVVVVWSEDIASNLERIMGRLFDDEGVPLGDEFEVGSPEINGQFKPRVSMAPDGQFVVVWDAVSGDSDRNAVLGRRYDSDAQPLGEVFVVNAGVEDDDQQASDVAMAPDGSFVAVWESEDDPDDRTYFQRFDSSGQTIGTPTQTSSSVPVDADDRDPTIAMDSQGRFAIAWTRSGVPDLGGGPNDTSEIRLRTYSASGVPFFDEISVGTQGDHGRAYVTLNDTGGWAVVWHTFVPAAPGRAPRGDSTETLLASRGTLTSDVLSRVDDFVVHPSRGTISPVYGDDETLEVIYYDSDDLVHVVRFDSAHSPIGSPFEVTPTGENPRMIALGNGRRFAVWHDFIDSESDDEVRGRVFDYLQNYPQFQTETERTANRYKPGDQQDPRVAMNEAGIGVVVWSGDAVNGDGSGISARIVNADGTPTPSTDIGIATNANVDALFPDVTWVGPDTYLVAWSEEAEDTIPLYYRQMPLDPLGLGGLRIPLATEQLNIGVKVAGRESDGTFAAVWTRIPNLFSGDGRILAKVIAGNGSTLRDLTTDNGIGPPRPSINPSVAVGGDHVLFVWQEENVLDPERDAIGGVIYEIVGSNAFFRARIPLRRFLGEKPSVAINTDGRSVIAWEGENAVGEPRLFAHCFNARMEPTGRLIEIDPEAGTANGFDDVEVAMDGRGNFSIAWSSNPAESFSENDVFLRRFDQFGFPLESEIDEINTERSEDQENPDIATNSRGNTLIVWEDDFEAPNDPDVRMLRLTSFRESSPYDIWADSFGDPTVLDPDGDSDGDGLCNLKEYIMNLNPLVPDAHLAPDPTFSYDSQSGIVGITLPWRERNDDESIVVEIEESTDLETWTVIGTMISLGMIDELTDLKSSDLFFDASEGRRHLRLRFSLQPVD